MFAVIGTVPDEKFPLACGPISLSGTRLMIENLAVDINRGTPALLATALKVCEFFDAPPPFAYLIGDIGTGSGSRKLYSHLEQSLPVSQYSGLTFHYIQPDVDWHNRVLLRCGGNEDSADPDCRRRVHVCGQNERAGSRL